MSSNEPLPWRHFCTPCEFDFLLISGYLCSENPILEINAATYNLMFLHLGNLVYMTAFQIEEC